MIRSKWKRDVKGDSRLLIHSGGGKDVGVPFKITFLDEDGGRHRVVSYAYAN